MNSPNAAPDGYVLAAEGLTKRYGRVTALSGLDLRISQGAVVALVGPNGAGKSTLLKTWMGFERPTSGRSLVMGLDPWVDRSVVGDVSFLAQQPSLYRELRVSEHLDLVAHFRPAFDARLAADRIASLAIRTDARIDELSGGEAAQVGLAIAIGLRARVLLLDEPLASLDPLARVEFLEVLSRHLRAGETTAVISSHVVAELEGVCTDLVVLGKGSMLLHEAISDARQRHWVTVAWVERATGRPIARLPGSEGSFVIEADTPPAPGARNASIQEITIAYLAAAKADP